MPRPLRTLQYSEELKMKKLVEQLRKKSQPDDQLLGHVLGESSLNTHHLNQEKIQKIPSQVNPSVSADVHHTLTPESRGPHVSSGSLNSVELQTGLHSISSSPHPSSISKRRKSIQSILLNEDTSSTKTSPKHSNGRQAALKPAIASLAGTARLASMCRRPQPPAKPRSERPSSAGGAFKTSTHSQQVKKTPSSHNQRSTVLSTDHLLTSSSSDESTVVTNTEESRLKHRKANRKKRKQLNDLQTTSERCTSGTSKGSSASSTIRSVKSAAELLEEAREIAMEGAQDADHQMVPQEPVLETLVKNTGQTANELITSPQIPDTHKGPSPSEVMNTELTEVQMDHSATQLVEEEDISVTESLQDVSSQVTETVLEARGARFTPVQRPLKVSQQPRTIHGLSLFATWTPKTDSGEYKTIHHFCTTPAPHVLPVDLQLVSRVCHSHCRLTTAQSHQQKAVFTHMATHPHTDRKVCEGVPVERVGETEQTGGVIHLPAQPSDALADWQRIAEYYVEKPRMMMCGHAATLCDGGLRMFWSPAPPKFSCAPCVIKDTLFPQYQQYQVFPPDLSSENLSAGLQAVTESGSDQKDMKLSTSIENVLTRNYMSLMDLREEESVPVPLVDVQSEQQVKRPFSAPHLTPVPESSLRLQSDYQQSTFSRELEHVWLKQESPVWTQTDSQFSTSQTKSQDIAYKPASPEQPSQDLSPSEAQPRRVRERRVLRKQASRSTSVCQSRHRTRKGGKKLSSAKLAYLHKKLKEQPHILARSESLCDLPQKPKTSTKLTVLLRYPSLPLLLDFEGFAAEQSSIPDKLLLREWVRNIWNIWADEVFSPVRISSIRISQQARRTHPVSSEQREKQPLKKEMQILDRADFCEVLDEGLTTADLQREVDNLTQIMTEQGKPSAFDLCRRGALYKQLGHLNQALEDLNTAISLEPHLLDAYWHRHSIYLLRNVPNRALDDLNLIIKHTKKHAGAFKSRAEIYRMRGETTLAIFNYTQAIKCKPDDAESYFQRAKLYEKTSESLLAMEDYAKTFAINPARPNALMKHGLYYFNSSNWKVALEDFSLLLMQEPTNTIARTYRGRIFSKLGQFQEAIEDFSLAVHLDPSDWLAFYHRGCLLRKIKPRMALRDLSISVLLNDGSENLGAFLHRGLLYKEQQQWRQAVADFKAVIRLDRTVAVAHINLGLIYMLKMGQNYEAIRMFSNALKVAPTCIRGYVCRAKAFHNVNDLKRALKDLTAAIHMRPDAQYLHIMRGKYLCEMEQFDLATFCIQYAAEMSEALGWSALQQAAVQSFLQNHAKAIACLLSAANTRPSPSILILLGKTQLKAHKFTEAVESFRKALSLLGPNETKLYNVPEASELYYLTGMCYMAQGEESFLPQALEAFSSAVRIKPDHADAHHQRGLCSMSLQQSECVQDFNKALHINPNFFQVFLSRAAFYGAKGQYSKAILNCDAVIRIQPKSVRAYLYRGALKFYSKSYKEALEDLTMAIKIDNSCSFAFYNRAVCYQQLQEYKQALQDYGVVLLLPAQREIELKVLINRALVYVALNDHYSALQDFKAAAMKQPEDTSIFLSLGVYHHRLGQLQEAMEAYSEALRLDPFLLDAYVGRGNVFMDYGHAQASKQAQRDFLSALHLNPHCSTARIGLAHNFQVFGCFQKAWNQFTVAVEVNPKCWAAYEGRAIVSLQMGNTSAAFQDINNALKCNPHSVTARLLTNRGVINQFLGDKVSAMSDHQRAISLNPTCALAFFNAANLYFYNRQFEQACEHYSRAFELDPTDESAVLNRAITLTVLRKVPEALQDFSEALRLNPYSAHVYFNRANLYCSIRKYNTAERDFTQALQLQPDDALLYKLRADVYGHLGRVQEAIRDYRTALELQDSA